MNKKEYLKNRFKRDFLQYSLLQDDSLPAKEIAGKLYNVIDIHFVFVILVMDHTVLRYTLGFQVVRRKRIMERLS